MSVYIPASLRQQVRERFNFICAYCQTAESLATVTFEIEHIVPLSTGGQTLLNNLCLACPTCNRFKGIRQEATDSLTNEVIQLFHPNQHHWNEHFAWSENFTEIIGLTSTGRVTIALLKMNRPQLVRLRKMWVSVDKHPPQIA